MHLTVSDCARSLSKKMGGYLLLYPRRQFFLSIHADHVEYPSSPCHFCRLLFFPVSRPVPDSYVLNGRVFEAVFSRPESWSDCNRKEGSEKERRDVCHKVLGEDHRKADHSSRERNNSQRSQEVGGEGSREASFKEIDRRHD